jgi:CHAT domain
MSDRTIVQIHPGRDGSFAIWLYEPNHFRHAAVIEDFPYRFNDQAPKDFNNEVGSVDDIGAYLTKALYSHPAVAKALHELLNAGDEDHRPLLLRISPEAEEIPWETAFANGSFLALDQRWSIARMSQQDRSGGAERDFQPPLHVMLILAANGVDATQEWEKILAALQTARFPAMVTAIVAQRELREKIAATKEKNIKIHAEMVPEGRGLIDVIRDAQPSPNLLHFFCHGAVDPGKSPYLSIATAPTLIGTGNPVTLYARDIPMDVLGDQLWLITLNCCRGAQSQGGAASFVFSLIRAGVPAVAGMRRPISDTDANVFSESFYRSLMRLLAPAAVAGATVEVDWTQTLYDARAALCVAHMPEKSEKTWIEEAVAIREWTNPVLYLGGQRFVLRGRPAPPSPLGPRRIERGRRLAERVGSAIFGTELPAPDLTTDERTAAEAELQILRDLVGIGLGAPEAALQIYRERIKQLEVRIFGSEQIRRPPRSRTRPPQATLPALTSLVTEPPEAEPGPPVGAY